MSVPYPDDEILSLRKRVSALESEVRRLSKAYFCEDCGVSVLYGSGLGVSVPEEEWTDRSKSRPMIITHLCKSCTSERIMKKEA